jgi:hypothetical protein
MMEIKTFFAIIASVIGVGSFIPYILDTFKKKTQPHLYTWLIWTILQVTGVIAMYANGAGIGALALTIGAFFCAFLCIISIKYGTKNITKFDTFCLIGGLVATGVYVFLHQPLLSVILISVIDFLGFLPALRKTYLEPHTETLSLYALFVISGTFSVLALSTYSLITMLYPLTLVAINTIATIVIWIRRKPAT